MSATSCGCLSAAGKDAEGWITGDGQRVMLTADEVVQLIACYWEADGAN